MTERSIGSGAGSSSRRQASKTTLEDLMKSPKIHTRGASRDRDGRSLTPSRHREKVVDLYDIGNLPLCDPETSSTKRGSGKLKKRSKSKDNAKAVAKEKVRSNKLQECGYGSDGVLDDVKQQKRRERRKDRERGKIDEETMRTLLRNDATLPSSLTSSAEVKVELKSTDASPPKKTSKKLTRIQSDPSMSPKSRGRSKSASAMKRIASMFKTHHHPSNVDSTSTLNTEEETSLASPISSKRENSLRSVRSITSTGSRSTKKRSSSSGPIRGGRKLTGSSSSVSSTLSEDGDIDNLSIDDTTNKKSSRGRSKERLVNHQKSELGLEELQEENERLLIQIERERQRSKRLCKKIKELKVYENLHDNENENNNDNNKNKNNNHDNNGMPTTTYTEEQVRIFTFEVIKRWHRVILLTDSFILSDFVHTQNLKDELSRKDNRIAELERMVSSLKRSSSERGLDVDSSNHDSLASIGSHRSKGSDAIWNRLQTQLSETREELARTEELLRAQTANLILQSNRVEELEQELKTNGIDTIRNLRDKSNLLQEEKKELESKLQTDRRDFEDRLQKKDEALIYFRNELQKLKQTSVDTQRSLVHSSSQASLLDGISTHSAQSSTVQRAFGGISHLVSPALWSKDKVSLDKNAIDGPKLNF